MVAYERAGTEFGVNTFVTDNQTAPVMARFADGGFVTLWVTLDTTQDGSGNAIKGQRFDANGNKVGSEFLVNSQGAGSQFNPSVAVLNNGSFIATWISNDTTQDGSGNAVKGQIFSASGVPVGGEFLVNSSVAGTQAASTVVALANGGFVVSWDDWNSFDTRARIFNANGTAIGPDFILNNNVNGTQDGGDLVALAGGGFAATWRTTDTTADGSGDAVKARIFDAGGAAVGNEFLVNTQAVGSQNAPSISQLANGNLIVTWYSSDTLQDGSNGAVKAQIFSPTGAKIGAEFLVNLQGVNTQNDPVVTSLPDGFMVAWVSSDPLQDGSGMAIKARVFNTAGVPVGSEFLVDTLATGDQFLPDLVTLADGRVVAAWTSTTGDGSGYAVRSQILAPSSAPVESVVSYYRTGTEFGVNTSVTNDQTAPAMARFASGGFVTLWVTTDATQDGSGNAIKGQRFDANGNKVGSEFLVNSQGAGSQFTPSVAVLSNGNFIATWVSNDTTQDGSGNAVKGQIFSASGAPVGGEFLVNSSFAGTQAACTVVALANGGFVVSWDDWNSFDTRARIFGANGTPIGADFILNNNVTGTQEGGDLVALAGGGFVATWRTTDTAADGDGYAVKARIFDATGNALGSEFLVNTQATAFQYSPSISQLANGNLIITWYSTDPLQDGSSGAIKAQIFSPTGAKIGAEFLVNAQAVNLQNDPVVTSLPNGGFMVAWVSSDPLQDGSGLAIKARVFNSDGVPVGSEFLVNTLATGDQFLPDLVTLADGRVVAAWTSSTGDGSGYAVRSQILAPNSAPVITSNGAGATASLAAAENQSAVTQVVATDLGGGGPVTYSISGGADAARFTINTTTGVLSFVTAPNFEVRTDSNSDGIYDVVVRASDGELSDTQAIAVTVTNVNEPLVITSNGGGDVAALLISENATAVSTVTAVDPEGTAPTYAITGGADAALFTINAATGALAFVGAPNFEAPADAGANNVYDVIVSASDGVFTDSQAVAVTVTNVNEPLVITSNGGGDVAALSVSENTTAVSAVTAVDPDGTAPTYAITGGADAALFTINAATGALAFVSAPNFEAPTDAGANNVYDVIVSASDGVFTDSQAIAVTVTNTNEGLSFTSGTAFGAAENTTAVATVSATDLDGDAVSYAIAGGADAALFAVDAATGVLSFIAAPNYETPGDAGADNIYDVVVSATDGSFTATSAIAISVGNVNEGLSITSGATFGVAENSVAVTMLSATDIDGDAVTFSIAGGADAALFTIDATSGALAFISAPNFELAGDAGGDNVYDVIVSATDGAFVDSRAIAVTVGNVNEATAITSNGAGDMASIAVAENGTAVTTVTASDPDGDPISFAIAGGADAALFTIDATTGVLSFIAAPDFEAPGDAGGDNVYDVVVQAGDGALIDTQALAVTVTNVNERPTITSSASRSVAENVTAAGAVVATDIDGDALVYAITGGADAAMFSIDAATGEVAFLSAPDFETPGDVDGDNVYEVVVSASDGSLVDTQTLLVTVGNVNEPVTITSQGGGDTAALSVAENGLTVATVTATDLDGTVPSFSIVGGADAARFTIDASTGLLTFIDAPDFEAPTDANADNVYDVIVQASDGALTDSQAIAVTVSNVNEAPVITSNAGGAYASVSVGENGTAVLAVTTSDPEGTVISYSIVGGADAGKFTINTATGALSFIAAPNFEAPTDTGADNVYDVIVQASDGSLTDSQAIAVTVTDANEAPVTSVPLAQTVRTATATYITGLSIADVDNGASETVTLTTTLGTVSATASAGASVTGAGTKSLVVSGTLAQVNATLASLSYTAGTAGSDTIQIATSDGSLSNAASIAVTVNATANHGPLIDASTVLAGAVTELAGTTGSVVADTAAGAIRFTDADASDTHTLTVSSVTATGTTTGLPAASTLLTYLVKGTLTEQSGTTPGAAPWTFSAPDKTFDFLNAGQTATLSYVVKLADTHGGFVNQNVVVTVTGTNDVPIVATGTLTGAITERASLTGSATADTASGLVKFTDADTGDIHAASITGVVASGVTSGLADTATLLGWFSKGALTEQVGTTAGSLAWTFSAADSAFDYLAAGEKAILTYTVAITDTAGVTLNQNVTVTVTGTSDAPVIDGSTVVTGSVTELAATTGSVVADTAAGAIRFTDADASDTHTLTVSSVTATGTTTGLPSSTTLLTYLIKGALTEQSGLTPGAAPWTFSAPDKTFDFLNAGQTATLSYVVKLADNHGGFVNQTVVVTVTGTNDAPIVATGTLTGAITERASLTGSTTADTASGLVKFTDADTGDVHTASITGVVASGVTTGLIDNATLLGWLGKGALTEQVGTTAGSLAWSFSAPDSAFDYLATGEKAILTYTVAITDTAGVTLNQNVTVTVTGTNDKPTAAAHDGLTTDNWTPLTVTASALLAGASDPDLSDTLSLSSVQSAVGGTIALVGGNAVFTPTATAIGAGSFTYTISDGHSGTAIATTNLTTTLHQITGTAGSDTLAGGAKMAQIDGLDGNDAITAGAAGDKITGGAGSDVLTGGAGIDTFIYHAGFGNDTINSFAATGTKHDVLQFDSNIFSDWAHLLGATTQQGSDLLITLDPGDTITLKNVALANFTSADASFV